MKTEYINVRVWNVTGTSTAEESCPEEEGSLLLERAASSPRRYLLSVPSSSSLAVQESREDNVVDFSAWKAAREDQDAEDLEDGWDEDSEDSWDSSILSGDSQQVRVRGSVPYTRRERTILFAGELMASLAVIAVAAALVLRVLFF